MSTDDPGERPLSVRASDAERAATADRLTEADAVLPNSPVVRIRTYSILGATTLTTRGDCSGAGAEPAGAPVR